MNILTRVFDFLKKKDMEKHYRQGGWRVEGPNGEIEKSRELISDRRYARCLDVGAGLGHFTELVSLMCDEVLAIDIAENAILQTQKRLAHLKNVHFKVRNLREVGDTLGTFDLIILAEVLYYLGDERFPNDFKRLLQQIARIVRPNGRILLVNYIAPWRDEQKLREYEEIFADSGLSLEKTITHSARGKEFLISVLRSQ